MSGHVVVEAFTEGRTGMTISRKQAATRVAAGLGRPVQDSLEAAVVLEALGGMRSSTALTLAPGAIDESPSTSHKGVSRRTRGVVAAVSTREVLGLVVTLLATTAWVAPLAAALGADATARAWQLALPVSIALQWMLRRRGMNGADGLSGLRGDKVVAIAGAITAAVVPVLLIISPAAMLPGALVVTWVGGMLLVVRGWGVAYGASLVVATIMLALGVPVIIDILLILAITSVAVVAAWLTSPATGASPTPWRRCLPAGAVGFLLALLIVTDPSVVWSSSAPFPVLALVPSLIASIWANQRLQLIWTVLVSALASTTLVGRAQQRNSRVFARIILGSFARLLLGTVVVSVLAFGLLRGSANSDSGLASLLVGLAAFGIVGFLAALLEAFSRVLAALGVTAASLAGAQLALNTSVPNLQNSSLAVAAVVAVLASCWPIARLVRHPDRTLATLI